MLTLPPRPAAAARNRAARPPPAPPRWGASWLFAAALAGGGGGAHPPPSQLPNGQAAIDRMKATFECARGVRGEAKLDHHGDKGRIRGNLLFFAVEPASVRFDVVSPFGAALATLTSDGEKFTFNDLREKKFYDGPASACNIARLTQVPIPGHALVALLHGQAPILVHKPDDATIRWDGKGYYVVQLPGTRSYQEELHIAPVPDDFQKPWSEQRMRVLDVRVKQNDLELYHAELGDHKLADMATAQIDEDNVEPPIPPSGPACSVEVPRRIHVEVTATDDDVLFKYEDLKVNPPLPSGTFTQPIPGGVQRVPVGECDR